MRKHKFIAQLFGFLGSFPLLLVFCILKVIMKKILVELLQTESLKPVNFMFCGVKVIDYQVWILASPRNMAVMMM